MADDSLPSSPTPETPPPRTTGGGFRWEPPTAAELQNLMPGYTIEKILGRGGMGAVYRGIQTNLDRPVAIKILPPGVEKEDPSFAERFKNEAKLMAKLMHPGVVGVFDFGKTSAGQLYFVMEYVDGSDVSQMIAAQGRLPPEHALAITAHVCDALQAAHELGIVHRDIKPANVLINMKGQVKVADFGLAKVEEPGSHGLTKTGYAMGTPDFVAPEALMLGTAIDGRADLYAVGVMLYQMLTGNIPRGAFKPASVLVPGLDPRFDSIIMKAMQHDRAERHQSAMELRRELDVILTVPFVRNDAPVSAAIPVAQVAQAPGQRSAAQKPVGKPPQPFKGSAGVPSGAAQPARNQTSGGAAAKMNEADKRTEGSREAIRAPTKSKAPLFIGLGAAAAIAVGAFVILGGGKKAKQSTPLAPSSGTNTPAAKSSETSKPAASSPGQATAQHSGIPPLPTTGWKPFITDMAKLTAQQGVTLLPGGWIRMQAAYIEGPPQRDVAVRTRLRFKGIEAWGIKVREQRVSRAAYTAAVSANGAEVMLRRTGPADKMLAKARLPRPLTREQEYELALAAKGDTLTVYLDGQPVLQERDTSSNDSATTVGASALMEIKDPQWLPLSPSSAAPVSQSSVEFPPGKWVKMFTKLEDLPEDLRKPDNGVKFEGGWLHSPKIGTYLGFTKQSVRNGGIRAVLGAREGWNRTRLQVRHGIPTPGAQTSAYVLGCLAGEALDFVRWKDGQNYHLVRPDLKRLQRGKEYTLELAVVEDFVIARLDGALLGVARDQSLEKGSLIANAHGDLRDIEVINLDGLSEAEALKILGVDEKGNDLRQKPAVAASATPAASHPTPAAASHPTPAAAKAAMAPASSSPSLPISQSSDPKFPPGQWVKVFTKFEELPDELRKPDSGVKFEDDALSVRDSRLYLGLVPHRHNFTNCALRAVINGSSFTVRLRDTVKGTYIGFGATGIELRHRSPNSNTPPADKLITFSTPEVGIAHAWEFAAVGNRLICRCDGRVTGQSQIDQVLTGQMDMSNLMGTVRDIEVINLDGLPEAEALRILGVDEKGNDLRALAAKQEQQKAEQAKAADAMAAIPELKTLHEQFVKLQGERVTAPFEAEVAKLNAGYVGGIDREIANEKKAGHLDGVIALEAEKKLIADQQPVPAEDDEKATEALKKLRGIYRAAHAKLEATRAENLKALTDPLSVRLKQLESTLTQQNRIDHAKTVREYRENLGKEGSADTPVRTSPIGGAAATMNEAGKSARAPLKKFPPGDDRKAAEWALDMGGVIDVLEGKLKRRIQSKADLPKKSFDLVYISIQADRPTKPVIDFADLSILTGLRQLSFLEIHGYPVQDDDTDYLATLPELKELNIIRSTAFSGRKLSLLKDAEKLERLNLGGSTQLAAEGVAQISQLSELNALFLNDCKLTDADLTPLRQLKKLAIISLPNTGVTLAGWRELKGLPLTRAVFINPTGQAAEWCGEIATLFPDIISFDFSRREPFPVEDISAAKAFTGLEEFILASTYTENAALAELAAFPKLTKLTLRGGGAGPAAKVTDEGIAHLAKLRTLQTLRLENLSEITEQGVIGLRQLKRLELPSSSCPKFDEAAFKKERPDVTVAR